MWHTWPALTPMLPTAPLCLPGPPPHGTPAPTLHHLTPSHTAPAPTLNGAPPPTLRTPPLLPRPPSPAPSFCRAAVSVSDMVTRAVPMMQARMHPSLRIVNFSPSSPTLLRCMNTWGVKGWTCFECNACVPSCDGRHQTVLAAPQHGVPCCNPVILPTAASSLPANAYQAACTPPLLTLPCPFPLWGHTPQAGHSQSKREE